MTKYDRLITLKEAVMYSNHTEENIRLQIERGLLRKYNKNKIPLKDPLKVKGFFKLSELMAVYNIQDPEIEKERFFARKHIPDSAKGIIPEKITVINSSEMNKLDQIKNNSIDTWILSLVNHQREKENTVTFDKISKSKILNQVNSYLKESQRIIKPFGNIIIHSIPIYIPYYGVLLEKLGFYFKYWIVFKGNIQNKQYANKFIPVANGILYYVKSPKNFRINKVRTPYRHCTFCKKPLKDYGGKKHLRHTDGMVLSDIWHIEKHSIEEDLPYNIPDPILTKLVDLSCNSETSLLLAPFNGEISNEFRK